MVNFSVSSHSVENCRSCKYRSKQYVYQFLRKHPTRTALVVITNRFFHFTSGLKYLSKKVLATHLVLVKFAGLVDLDVIKCLSNMITITLPSDIKPNMEFFASNLLVIASNSQLTHPSLLWLSTWLNYQKGSVKMFLRCVESLSVIFAQQVTF